MTGAYTPQCTVQSSNSERSKVPTWVLFALAWLPKYFKNVTLDHQSTTDYPNSVFQSFIRLLTRYRVYKALQCSILLQCTLEQERDFTGM